MIFCLQNSHQTERFTEDFDFMAMNEKFNKDEVWGHLGKNTKSHPKYTDGDEKFSDEEDVYEEDDGESSNLEIKVSDTSIALIFLKVFVYLPKYKTDSLYVRSLCTIRTTFLIPSRATMLTMKLKMEGGPDTSNKSSWTLRYVI